MNRKERRAAAKHGQALPVSGDNPGRSDLASMFSAALRAHQAGQLDVAEAYYRQLLAIEPEHSNGLYGLGLIALQVGQAAAAAELIGKAIRLDDRFPERHYHIALACEPLGRWDEALVHYRRALALRPDYAEAHLNLGNALVRQGKPDLALASYERVLALRPDNAEAHYNIANLLARRQQYDNAVVHYRRALALRPDLAEACNNLGSVLREQGKLHEAATEFRRAIALRPDLADAHCNLGTTAATLGEREQAMVHLGRATELDPGLAEAHNNLGNLIAQSGPMDAAVACYERAIACKPDFVEAHENLARVLLALGDVPRALAVLREALARGERSVTKGLVVACLQKMPHDGRSDLRHLVLRALAENWGWAHDLELIAARLVKANKTIGAAVARTVQEWPRRLTAAELFGAERLAEFAADDLLICLLRCGIVRDLDIEQFLTNVRFALLDLADSTPAVPVSADALELFGALAQQCFANEYIFATTDSEAVAMARMRQDVLAAIDRGARPDPIRIVALAAYHRLADLPDASRLGRQEWPDPVHALIHQQIEDVEREREFLAAIPRLTRIEDAVSAKVREQYEQNPYPRWVKSAPPAPPVAIEEYLQAKFPLVRIPTSRTGAGLDVLIAGCGTGLQAVESAQRFVGARILAVDLSRSSLAYALRKTQDMGLRNIEYAQADLLEFGAIDRSFDLIEASGVLHHLADPCEGWRVLLSRLRPGGFMNVGLYSRHARQEVRRGRAHIVENRHGCSPEEIRRCRAEFLSDDADPLLRNLVRFGDFWTTSGCRDLLFHVQEHQLDIPQIAAFLAESEIEFLGFDIDPAVVQQFRLRFPNDPAATNLANWDAFEAEHPRVFSGMYQFWVCRTASPE